MPRSTRKEEQPASKAGLPFIPERWSSEEEFRTAFKRAAELRRKERESGFDEDGSISLGPIYQGRRRYSDGFMLPRRLSQLET